MRTKKEYKPISCDYYDRLEIIAMRKTVADVKYRDDSGSTKSVSSRIDNLETRNKVEYLILEGGKELRLDDLISVNGKVLDGSC